MLIFRYKVLKPFVVFKTDTGELKIAQTEEEKKSGSKYSMSTKYVDYRFEKAGLGQADITHILESQKYIQLIDQVSQ